MVARTCSTPGLAATTRTIAVSRPFERRRKASAAPLAGPVVANLVQPLDGEGIRHLIGRRATVSHSIEPGQSVREAHAFEMGPVAERAPGGRGPFRSHCVAHSRLGEGSSRGVGIFVHTDTDVFSHLHHGRIAPGGFGPFSYSLSAPGNLFRGAPVQGSAIGRFSTEA